MNDQQAKQQEQANIELTDYQKRLLYDIQAKRDKNRKRDIENDSPHLNDLT